MKQLIRSILPSILAIGIFIGSPALAADIRIVGSTTVNGAVFAGHKAELEKAIGLTFRVIPNGSSHGLEDLLKGDADIAMISAPLEVEKVKLTLEGKDALVETPIGTSTVAFITTTDNKVNSLTTDQVKGILNGDITDWSKVGGTAGPITIIAEVEGGGIRTTVEKALLGGPIKADVKSVANGKQVVMIASQIPGAFGIAAVAIAGNSGKIISLTPPIQQPLAFVTKGAPSDNAKKLIEAVKKLNLK